MELSTVVRELPPTVMVITRDGRAGEIVIAGLERAGVAVVQSTHVALACEQIPLAMPQVIVVVGPMRADERDALWDRTTAVGATVLFVNPALDEESLQDFARRAATTATERNRKMRELATARVATEQPNGLLATTEPPAGASDDVDAGWDGDV